MGCDHLGIGILGEELWHFRGFFIIHFNSIAIDEFFFSLRHCFLLDFSISIAVVLHDDFQNIFS